MARGREDKGGGRPSAGGVGGCVRRKASSAAYGRCRMPLSWVGLHGELGARAAHQPLTEGARPELRFHRPLARPALTSALPKAPIKPPPMKMTKETITGAGKPLIEDSLNWDWVIWNPV